MTTLYDIVELRFLVAVSCEFCGSAEKVPFFRKTWWLCSSCKQFNDKKFNTSECNRYCASDEPNVLKYSYSIRTAMKDGSEQLCRDCNKKQERKVLKLHNFQPSNETNYEREYKAYEKQLEEEYSLCNNCEQKLFELNKLHMEKFYHSTPNNNYSTRPACNFQQQFSYVSPVTPTSRNYQSSRLETSLAGYNAEKSLKAPCMVRDIQNLEPTETRTTTLSFLKCLLPSCLKHLIEFLNVMISLAVVFHNVSEHPQFKAHVARLFALHSSFDTFIRFSFDNVSLLAVLGNACHIVITELFHKSSYLHVFGTLTWVVSLYSSSVHHAGRRSLETIITFLVVTNFVISFFCFVLDLLTACETLSVKKRSDSAELISSNHQLINDRHRQSGNKHDSDQIPTKIIETKKSSLEAPNVMLGSLSLVPQRRKESDKNCEKENFKFFNSNLRTKDFKKNLASSEMRSRSDQPIISPPKFTFSGGRQVTSDVRTSEEQMRHRAYQKGII